MDDKNLPYNSNELNVIEVADTEEFQLLAEQTNMELEEAKNNFKQMVSKGLDAIDIAFQMLEATDGDPRSIEAFATLVRAINSANRELVSLQKTKHDIVENSQKEKNGEGNGGPTTQNNAIFFGSTEELRKLFQKV